MSARRRLGCLSTPVTKHRETVALALERFDDLAPAPGAARAPTMSPCRRSDDSRPAIVSPSTTAPSSSVMPTRRAIPPAGAGRSPVTRTSLVPARSRASRPPRPPSHAAGRRSRPSPPATSRPSRCFLQRSPGIPKRPVRRQRPPLAPCADRPASARLGLRGAPLHTLNAPPVDVAVMGRHPTGTGGRTAPPPSSPTARPPPGLPDRPSPPCQRQCALKRFTQHRPTPVGAP